MNQTIVTVIAALAFIGISAGLLIIKKRVSLLSTTTLSYFAGITRA